MSISSAYMICRLCGYKHKGTNAPDACPACGAPKSSFTSYIVKVSEKRLKILNLDIHPIMTHFSVGGAIIIFLTYFLSFLTPEVFGITIGYGGIMEFFVIFEPIFAVITGITGIIDGKLRYNTVKTKYLKAKIGLGIGLVINSSLVLLFHILSNAGSVQLYMILEGIFIVIVVLEASLLGFIGSKLLCNIVPMGKIK